MVVKVGCAWGQVLLLLLMELLKHKVWFVGYLVTPPPGDTGGAGRDPLPLHFGQSLSDTQRGGGKKNFILDTFPPCGQSYDLEEDTDTIVGKEEFR